MPVAVVVETRDDPGERFVAVAGDLIVLAGLQGHSLLSDLRVQDRRPVLHIADTPGGLASQDKLETNCQEPHLDSGLGKSADSELTTKYSH